MTPGRVVVDMVRNTGKQKSAPQRPRAGLEQQMRVLVVTGLSGAGKSSTLKTLEDLGYEAVDNLPLSLLPNLIVATRSGQDVHNLKALAIGVDMRTRAFQRDTFVATMNELRGREDLDVSLVFLDCSDEVLHHRFTATRRRHPLANDRPVVDGIRREREIMAGLRAQADYMLDTTDLKINDLRQLLNGYFALDAAGRMLISLVSFSYLLGLPREADLVFDVRFLRNPHYIDGLRAGTGQEAAIADYIRDDPAYQPFLDTAGGLILSLLPQYQREGKSYLTIAFGCTGGRHRSVFVAEEIAGLIRSGGFEVSFQHRDLAPDSFQQRGLT